MDGLAGLHHFGNWLEGIRALREKLQPETVSFLADGGERGGLIFSDMQESGDIPGIAKMLFQGADAAVEFMSVMNADDLRNAP